MQYIASHAIITKIKSTWSQQGTQFPKFAYRHSLLQHLTSSVDILDLKGNKKKIDALLLKVKEAWDSSFPRKIGRLAQDISTVKVVNASDWIPNNKVPIWQTLPYLIWYLALDLVRRKRSEYDSQWMEMW